MIGGLYYEYKHYRNASFLWMIDLVLIKKILRENKVIDILERKHNVIDLGDISVPFLDAKEKFFTNPKMKYLNEVIECNTSLAEKVYLALNNGTIPFILGGDHSLALGSLAGASKYFNDDLAVVWIDAHGDLNTHETSLSGNIHGMPGSFHRIWI